MNMTWKSGKSLLAGAAVLLCVGLWSAQAPAQTSAWEHARTDAVAAYWAGDYASAEEGLRATAVGVLAHQAVMSGETVTIDDDALRGS